MARPKLTGRKASGGGGSKSETGRGGEVERDVLTGGMQERVPERGVSVREPEVRARSHQRKVSRAVLVEHGWQSVSDVDLGLQVVKRAGDVRRHP